MSHHKTKTTRRKTSCGFCFVAINIFHYLCQKFIAMRSRLFIIAVFGLALTACKKYEPQGGDTPAPVYPSYQIGDYYHNDTLQGIVFYTTAGGSTGLMVSLDESLLPWCAADHINEETGATNPYDGWHNTNTLMANYDLSHYPAIQWSHRKNTWHLVYHDQWPIRRKQWYVPSSEELSYLLQNQQAVNATLRIKGYPTLEDKTYWSSTETGTRAAAAGHVQNNGIVINDSLKTQVFYVRAVRSF